jgi:hypothetical protein
MRKKKGRKYNRKLKRNNRFKRLCPNGFGLLVATHTNFISPRIIAEMIEKGE